MTYQTRPVAYKLLFAGPLYSYIYIGDAISCLSLVPCQILRTRFRSSLQVKSAIRCPTPSAGVAPAADLARARATKPLTLTTSSLQDQGVSYTQAPDLPSTPPPLRPPRSSPATLLNSFIHLGSGHRSARSTSASRARLSRLYTPGGQSSAHRLPRSRSLSAGAPLSLRPAAVRAPPSLREDSPEQTALLSQRHLSHTAFRPSNTSILQPSLSRRDPSAQPSRPRPREVHLKRPPRRSFLPRLRRFSTHL